MSLPPELGAIDDAWGEDEQPTIARPSRIPTSPARIEFAKEAPTAPGIDVLALDLARSEEEADMQERVTTVPEIPLDEFARRAMRSDSAASKITDVPPPEAPPPAGYETHSPDDRSRKEQDIRSAQTQVPDSTVPTAPPPPGVLSVRGEGYMPPPSNLGVSLQALDSDAAPPPLSQPRREPRKEPGEFSGRFSSAPPDAASAGQKMKDRFAMGDFSGALELAEQLLKTQPSNGEAQSLAKKCREVLEDMYSSRISGLEMVPGIIMGPDQIRWLSLDHRAGFLLSMIDGVSSVDDLLDVSGMQRLDALRILCELLDQKVISLS